MDQTTAFVDASGITNVSPSWTVSNSTCAHTPLEILEREVGLLSQLSGRFNSSNEVREFAEITMLGLLKDYFGEVVTPAQEHAETIEQFNKFLHKERI